MAKDPTFVFRNNSTGEVLLEVSGPSLREIDLTGVNLSGAALYAIEVVGMPPSGRRHSDLAWSTETISGARLRSADLSDAVLSGSTIGWADLSGANLRGAILVRSHFLGVDLTGADLTGARLMSTVFARCSTLGAAVGLDAVEHRGPSTLDVRTLRSCIDVLPDDFLLGTGYTSGEIGQLRALYRREHKFHSCFISYARQDSEFANRLRSRLIRNNISCWQDIHDMRAGDYWRRQVSEAIDKHDKLVLVCSRTSLERPAVVAEIFEAVDRERATRMQKLFPIRLDDYVLSDELDEIAKSKVASGEWRENWVTYVRAYHIPDFSSWTNNQKFSAEFRKLLEALRQPPGR